MVLRRARLWLMHTHRQVPTNEGKSCREAWRLSQSDVGVLGPVEPQSGCGFGLTVLGAA